MIIAYRLWVSKLQLQMLRILSLRLERESDGKFVIKLLRAQGECLGDKRRRRT